MTTEDVEMAQSESSSSVAPPDPKRRDSHEEKLGWNGDDDSDNPFNWSISKKRVVTVMALVATFTTLMNGTIIAPAHDAIADEFRVYDTNFPNSYWPISTWALGGAFFSLIVLPLMEDFGVRFGFLGTYVVFIFFIIPQALAKSFTTLCVCRFFAGGCASVLANTTAGVIGNIWDGDIARTLPVGIFIVTFLTGTSIGPVIGGVIIQYLNWKWISYIQLIWHGLLFPLQFAFFHESRAAVILMKRSRNVQKDAAAAQQQRRSTWQHLQNLRQSVQRPLFMLVTEPVVFFFTLWSSFTVGLVYLFTQSVEQVFRDLYGWTIPQASYVQIAIVLGQWCGLSSIFLSRKLYLASATRNREIPGKPVPEGRLYVSILGTFLGLGVGLFIYAWTSFSSLPWVAPAIGIFVVGCGMTTVMMAIADYAIDAYTKYAGSCVAAVVLGENLVAAFLPLAAQSMYDELGFNWASTLLGLIAVLLSFVPVAVLIWGHKLRARSPFMEQSVISKSRY